MPLPGPDIRLIRQVFRPRSVSRSACASLLLSSRTDSLSSMIRSGRSDRVISGSLVIAFIVQNLTHYASMRTFPVSLHSQDGTEQLCDTCGVAHAMDLPHEQ